MTPEQARAFFRSPEWLKMLRPELEKLKARQAAGFETATEMSAVCRVQGAVRILDALLSKEFQDGIAKELAKENE